MDRLDLEPQMTGSKMVGRRLGLIREMLGHASQTEMAEALGVTLARYNNWELGDIILPVKYALMLRRMCGVTLDYIYAGDLSCVPHKMVLALEARASSSDAPESEP